jgi:site-specific DNA-methyltransferase (adenine-specific)
MAVMEHPFMAADNGAAATVPVVDDPRAVTAVCDLYTAGCDAPRSRSSKARDRARAAHDHGEGGGNPTRHRQLRLPAPSSTATASTARSMPDKARVARSILPGEISVALNGLSDRRAKVPRMDGPSVVPPKFHLAQRDAVAWLRTLPSESVDLIVTDPPYESLEKHRAIGTTTRLKHSKASSNDWFAIFPNARFPELFAEVHRVLRRNTHFYLFCDPETMFVAKPLAEAADFKFWKPLIWNKQRIGMGYHYRARYECILFFEKGKRKLNDLGIADIIDAPRISGGYPAEKPSEVSEVLIRQSTEPGQLVVDPFMGSGSVGVAAVTSGRMFCGNDLCEEAIAITRQRLLEAGASEVVGMPASSHPGRVTQLGLAGLDSALGDPGVQ